MAELLYKLGLFSAKRAWVVITSWVIILAATTTFAITSAATLSTAMSIPGIPSALVIKQLEESFPDASRGNGQVVFFKDDGSKFTADEKTAIGETLAKVVALPGVDDTLDPFKTQAQIDQQRADLVDGLAKIADGKVELAAAQKKLDAGLVQLEAAKADLEAKAAQVEAGIAQARAAGAPEAQIAPLLQSQAQIEAGLAQIETQYAEVKAGQTKIDDGLAEIATNETKIALGQKLLDSASGFGTVAKSGDIALANIYFELPINRVEQVLITNAVDTIKNADIGNVKVEFSQALSQSLDGILGVGEAIGLVIAAVVLFVMLGTFIGAGMPVLTALLGVGISATLTLGLASQIEMTSTTPILGVMLGLAVGIDYSLFILNRHRRQLKAGMGISESIALANGTSGNAVMFAGITVIIALVALNLTGVGFLGLMGSMGAVAIVIAVLAALTFTPALIKLAGLRVLSKKERIAAAAVKPAHTVEELHEAEKPKNATKPVWASKHPWLAILAAGAVLAIVAIPASSMRLGLPDGGSEPTDTSPYKAYQLTTEGFGAGANGQIVTVIASETAYTEDRQLEIQAGVAEQIMALDNVQAVIPAGVSEDARTMIFAIVPIEGPATEATETLVKEIRDLEASVESEYQSTLGVTGITASNIDVSQKLADALPLYLGTVIVLSFFLLILVFRSIAVPLIASAGFLLTVFATFGAVVAVHQWGWLGFMFGISTPGPILSFLPTILIGILFGLAMDYQLFLVSGMREAYVSGKSPINSINFGIHLGRPVVIAAALIMVTVFGGFAFSHVSSVRPIGFGLAIGVLIDAFLVRLILVPATMTILGKAAWWLPKWLDRILPDVDVEGAKLEKSHIH